MMAAHAGSEFGWLTLGNAEFASAIFIGGAAVVEDLARRTISNIWPVAALVAGIGCQVASSGWMGLGYALLGTVVGFLVFLIFYLLGGMGGGDVKLMAGFGALLGTGRLLQAALFTALAGGLLAVAVLAVQWLRRRRQQDGSRQAISIPYAPAIATGVWLALLAARP